MEFRSRKLLAVSVLAVGLGMACSSSDDGGSGSGGSGGGSGAAGSAGSAAPVAVGPAEFPPEELGFPAPDPLPDLPAGVDHYAPPRPDESPDTIISEGVNVGDPGDTLVVTGDGFVPATTVFDIFSQASQASAGETTEAQPGHIDAYAASITLPETLPVSGMYLIYPRTESTGLPFGVNRTAARWVGPDLVAPGETTAAYGTNLSYGHGTETSYVYLKPVDAGQGQYAQVGEVNPYRVDFEVPSDLTPGEHEVWVHNGHGGHYGWSGPLLLEVVETSPFAGYDSQTFNVKDYGRHGGRTDRRSPSAAGRLAGRQGRRSGHRLPACRHLSDQHHPKDPRKREGQGGWRGRNDHRVDAGLRSQQRLAHMDRTM